MVTGGDNYGNICPCKRNDQRWSGRRGRKAGKAKQPPAAKEEQGCTLVSLFVVLHLMWTRMCIRVRILAIFSKLNHSDERLLGGGFTAAAAARHETMDRDGALPHPRNEHNIERMRVECMDERTGPHLLDRLHSLLILFVRCRTEFLLHLIITVIICAASLATDPFTQSATPSSPHLHIVHSSVCSLIVIHWHRCAAVGSASAAASPPSIVVAVVVSSVRSPCPLSLPLPSPPLVIRSAMFN